MLGTIVTEFAVNLVSEEEEVVFLGNLTQFQDFLFGVQVTSGVVGVTDHDSFRLRGDYLLEILDGRQCEAVLDGGNDGLHDNTAHGGESVVVGIERFRDDDFVARIHAAVEGEKETFATTGGNDDFVDGDVDTHAVVVFHQFFAVAEISSRVAVSDYGNVGVAHGITGTFRGLNVGLTDVKVVNVDTTTFGGIRKWHQLPDGGRLHACAFLGNFRHNY